MSDRPILTRVAAAVADALSPLDAAFASPVAMAQFLTELGWPVLAEDLTNANAAFGPLPQAIEALAEAATALENSSGDTTAAAGSVEDAIRGVAAAARGLTIPANVSALPPIMQDASFWAAFASDVVDFLLYTYLERSQSALFTPLRLVGVLRTEPPPAGDSRVVDRKVVDWSTLGQVLSSPLHTLQAYYGWGSTLNVNALMATLQDASRTLELPGVAEGMEDALVTTYWGPTPPSDMPPQFRWAIWSAIVELTDAIVASELDLVLAPIPASPSSTAEPTGLVLTPQVTGALNATQQITESVALQLTGAIDLIGGLEVIILPSGVKLATGVADTTTLGVTIQGKPSTPWTLLGSAGETRIEIASAHAGVLVLVHPSGSPEVQVVVALDSATFVLEPGDLDGFLSSVFPSTTQKVSLATKLTWSSLTGIHLGLSGGLTVQVPIGISLGPVEIESAQIGLSGDGTGSGSGSLDIGLSAGLSLGPLSANVTGVGVKVHVGGGQSGGGNLGNAAVSLGFRPPDGAGLLIDAGLVTGGGFASFDDQRGQYAGILELALESLSLTATGLIQTKNADGTPFSGGFSLLVVIDATFLPPVQLGFGFGLNGVGGLLGLNRTTNVDALRAGVRSGSIADVMFPADPVGHAPQLIQHLSGFFPAAPGRFLIGPMVEIEWGSPAPILTADLGVVVELPAPIRVVILGVLTVGLPQADESAVVRLNLDSLGVVDLGQGTLSLDASLFDSRVVEFAVSRDMALRLGWKQDPEFLLSIGGWHPAFTPPPGFPTLNRLAISLSSGDNPTFRLAAYLAVTSNTVQFGAKAQLSLHAGPARLDGMVSFDALIHLNPFGLEIDFAASLSVSFEGQQLLGISVGGHISGPDPWKISGHASISILFISVSVSFHVQLGSGTPPPPPAPIRVIDLLAAEVGNPTNWSALPPAGDAVVTLTTAPSSGSEMRAHPLGSLTFRQHTVPLNLALQKFGSASVAGPTKLALTSIGYGSLAVQPTEVDDDFAPAQFLKFSDSDALSQPSFATYQAGIAFTPTGPVYDELAVGDAASVACTVEVIDPDGEQPADRTSTLDGPSAARQLPTSPAAHAPSRTTGARRYQGAPGTIAVVTRPRTGVLT